MNFTIETEIIHQDNYKVHSTEMLPVRFLTIGDPHFKISNLDKVDQYIERVEQCIQQTQPDFVIVLGDLLHDHEKIHTKVLNRAYSFIDRIRTYCPVFVIVGNHDYINNQQYLTENHWMNGMKQWENVVIVDKGYTYKTMYGEITLCPYVFPGRFKEALNTFHPDWKQSRIVCCHQEFKGAKMGAIISEVGDEWEGDDPFVLSGHIHDKQRVQDNLFYVGSSMQHAFGESTDKTICLVELSEFIHISKINLQLPTKKIIYVDVQDLEKFEKQPVQNEEWKITVTGSVDEFKAFRKTKKFKELSKQHKIVYKQRAEDTAVETNLVKENHTFHEILENIIKEKQPNLLPIYNSLK